MKLSQLKINFTTALQGFYDKEEVHCFFFMLCDFFLQYSRFEVSMSQDTVVSETNIARFEKVLLRLKTQEPIQYILGYSYFNDLKFTVNKNVLALPLLKLIVGPLIDADIIAFGVNEAVAASLADVAYDELTATEADIEYDELKA